MFLSSDIPFKPQTGTGLMLRGKEKMRLHKAREKSQVLETLIRNNSFAAEGLDSRCVRSGIFIMRRNTQTVIRA